MQFTALRFTPVTHVYGACYYTLPFDSRWLRVAVTGPGCYLITRVVTLFGLLGVVYTHGVVDLRSTFTFHISWLGYGDIVLG